MMLSVCMFFFCMGDAVSQAAQTFLPAVIGRPAAARSLGKQLMTTGVVVGVVNCAAAGDAPQLQHSACSPHNNPRKKGRSLKYKFCFGFDSFAP